MRKLLTWAAATAAVAGLVRWLRRRGRQEEGVAEPDHAEELRRKLAASRGEEAQDAEPPPPPPEATVEERRAEVHEQGRETLEEMGRPGET